MCGELQEDPKRPLIMRDRAVAVVRRVPPGFARREQCLLDGMSGALDLVEEFRSLDEIGGDANDGSGHRSIGERKQNVNHLLHSMNGSKSLSLSL